MLGNSFIKPSTTTDNNNNNYSRVMLRFRPIAPKPPGGSDAPDPALTNGSAVKRTKRKYVRVRCRQTKRKNPPVENSFVTLQLLPERSQTEQIRSVEENLETNLLTQVDQEVKSFRSVVDTWIIVESITEGSYGVGLGFTDKDRVSNLEADTCPGFVSDGGNKVVWVNDAYRRMVRAEEGGVCVSLVVNEKLPNYYSSFACRVRMIQGNNKQGHKIVPCDVWRMDFQGFAWKLDVNTALSL